VSVYAYMHACVVMGAWERVCACTHVGLVIRYAMHMHYVVCDDWLHQIFQCYLKRHDFGEKLAECKMCVLIFSTSLFETFLILRRIQGDIVITVKTSSHKVPIIVVEF
jgi:hypothetical protein